MEPGLDFLRLFNAGPPAERDGKQVRWRVFRRGGSPFLLLPPDSRERVATLGLYAPQTLRARLSSSLLRLFLRLPASFPGESVGLEISSNAPFVKFLSSLVPGTNLPGLGILAGNPNASGQRFTLVCFSIDHRPVAVVKAALTQRGRELIEHEASFLSVAPAKFKKNIPAMLAKFQFEEISAFAMPFVEGKSPEIDDDPAMVLLLNSWLDTEKTLPISEMQTWLQLERNCKTARPLLQAIASKCQSRLVHPCVQHGDFVPWNIKVDRGTWTVIDWERGELLGIPGWDWFHYVIQPGILVKRQDTSTLIDRVGGLLGSDHFKDYASRSAIGGLERELLLGYLLYQIEIIQPSEGLAQTRELLTALASRWQIGNS